MCTCKYVITGGAPCHAGRFVSMHAYPSPFTVNLKICCFSNLFFFIFLFFDLPTNKQASNLSLAPTPSNHLSSKCLWQWWQWLVDMCLWVCIEFGFCHWLYVEARCGSFRWPPLFFLVFISCSCYSVHMTVKKRLSYQPPEKQFSTNVILTEER